MHTYVRPRHLVQCGVSGHLWPYSRLHSTAAPAPDSVLTMLAVQFEDLTGVEVRLSHRAIFEASLAYLALPRVSLHDHAAPD